MCPPASSLKMETNLWRLVQLFSLMKRHCSPLSDQKCFPGEREEKLTDIQQKMFSFTLTDVECSRRDCFFLLFITISSGIYVAWNVLSPHRSTVSAREDQRQKENCDFHDMRKWKYFTQSTNRRSPNAIRLDFSFFTFLSSGWGEKFSYCSCRKHSTISHIPRRKISGSRSNNRMFDGRNFLEHHELAKLTERPRWKEQEMLSISARWLM